MNAFAVGGFHHGGLVVGVEELQGATDMSFSGRPTEHPFHRGTDDG
jgi:hypothetical protein